MKSKIIIVFIVVLAILFRLFFILKTTASEVQYDFGLIDLNTIDDYNKLYTDFDKGNLEARHINYIMHIYNYWTLPEKIIGEFYHPPLHHFIMAVWLKVMDLFSSNSIFKIESMQIIPFIYSLIIIVVFIKIMEELEIKNKIVPLLLISFYPIFIYLSGALNNDELVILFELICLLYLIKWRKDPSYKNTIIGSLAIGLGAMTKSSMFVMIIPAVFLFFKVLKEHVENDKSIKKMIIEIIILCIIVVPLSFWYHIYRNGESLGIITPFEHFSVKDKSVYERFGLLNLFEVKNYNIWNATLLTSIEFVGIHSNLLIKIIIALDIILIINWIYLFIKSKKDSFLIFTNIAWWISYIYFFISMPYVPTINIRYVIIPVLISYLDIGKGLDSINNKYIKIEVYTLAILISILSTVLWISLI